MNPVAADVWAHVGALRSLLERAERDLVREPDAYVAVAVVRLDRREEQVGRWGWSGAADALQAIGRLGPKVGAEDRGLRVRLHRAGGGLVGSVLIRRLGAAAPTGGRRAQPSGQPGDSTSVNADHLSRVEAQLAMALAALAAQGRELVALRAELGGLQATKEVVERHEDRLVEVEAVVDRLREAEAMLAERWCRSEEGNEDG